MAGWVIQPMETRLFLHGQGAGIGIFSSAFQEAESKPKTDPGILCRSWRKITRNVGYQHVPTILPDQREKWGTLFGTWQEGTWRNITLIVSECPRFVGVFPYSNSSSLCFQMNYYIGWQKKQCQGMDRSLPEVRVASDLPMLEGLKRESRRTGLSENTVPLYINLNLIYWWIMLFHGFP